MWKIPPSAVMPPVMAPRTSGDPRPVCSPVSDSPSEMPMLIPAPSAVESPTTNAVCEFEETAAAKIGAIEETVPSIMPTSAGCTTRSTNERSFSKPARCTRRAISEPPRWCAVFTSVFMAVRTAYVKDPLRTA